MLRVWQPFSGCSPISPGCANCKSPILAGELSLGGIVTDTKNGLMWEGSLRFNEDQLNIPLQQLDPGVYQVNPFGDLFHDSAPIAWINRVFDVIDSAKQHSFQILTKRSNRQREYLSTRYESAPTNVAFGVSCERQKEADERIMDLINTNVHTRFVTLYPLLGPIDLRKFLRTGKINFVAAGEEQERPANQQWFRTIKLQCDAVNVNFIQSNRLVGERV